jgi:hypothetical protein
LTIIWTTLTVLSSGVARLGRHGSSRGFSGDVGTRTCRFFVFFVMRSISFHWVLLSPISPLSELLVELFCLERSAIESKQKTPFVSLLAWNTCNRVKIGGIHLLAAVQLLDGSLDGFTLGVRDGSEAAELSSVVIARQVHVFDLAVLLDDGA